MITEASFKDRGKQERFDNEPARQHVKVRRTRPPMKILGEILNLTAKDKTDSMKGFAVRSLDYKIPCGHCLESVRT